MSTSLAPRPRRALKILAVLLAIPILGIAVAYVWIHRVADARWAAAQARIRELSAAFPEVVPALPGTEAAKELQIHFVAVIRQAAR